MLTMLVRAIMFPLGRKQARAAQQMQELQPHLKELQEKYKDNKEKITAETMALYRAHGVNPLNGCLPALIQLPIFVGLWQALNTSFPLRQATFLWIGDLAAPDMLFRFPGNIEIPYLGHWLNILPFFTVALILVQTKLFTPPATTPEAESQQKFMKVMMIFMGVMFYKVPAGLGIYFITSSIWAICERLLLPKPKPNDAAAAIESNNATSGGSRGSKALPGGNGTNGRGEKGSTARGSGKSNTVPDVPHVEKPKGKIAQFFEKVLDEARKDPTYRKLNDEREGKGRDDGKGREKEKDKGGESRPRPRRR
jgi:YidC/Oxa1 family membrane protein insertase